MSYVQLKTPFGIFLPSLWIVFIHGTLDNLDVIRPRELLFISNRLKESIITLWTSRICVNKHKASITSYRLDALLLHLTQYFYSGWN